MKKWIERNSDLVGYSIMAVMLAFIVTCFEVAIYGLWDRKLFTVVLTGTFICLVAYPKYMRSAEADYNQETNWVEPPL
ncbi:MAG: hypothetical protein AAB774_02455 [Patescibacteria group bacterium]